MDELKELVVYGAYLNATSGGLEMILLSLSVLILGVGLQAQQEPPPAPAAPVLVTEVIAMTSPKPGVAGPDVLKLVPDELQEVVQLYQDGKIEQWYARADHRGVILILRCQTVDEAKAILAALPMVKIGYVNVDYIPVGPYTRWRSLMKPQ